MTAAPGTRRLAASQDTLQARMWAWMRARRRKPWTCAELAAAAGASERQARRYAGRLAAAGWLADRGLSGGEGGRTPAHLWSLAKNPGPIPPVLIGGAAGSGVENLNGTMTGAELMAIRHGAGLSLGAFAAEALQIRDPRTARRYEQAEIVPAPAAARVRAWLAANG